MAESEQQIEGGVAEERGGRPRDGKILQLHQVCKDRFYKVGFPGPIKLKT